MSLKSTKVLILIVVGLFFLGLPLFASQFVSYLMLTFFAYAITVLRVLISSLAIPASSPSAMLFLWRLELTQQLSSRAKFSVLYMEVILVVAVIISSILAALIGAICVRYIKIYFAMLTLAFGMLFYTFLLKFYYLTGGDEGMRVLRPYLLGFNLSEIPKMQYLTGSYYIYTFVILAILTFVMWKIVSSPFGLCLKAIRDNPEKAEYLGVSVKEIQMVCLYHIRSLCCDRRSVLGSSHRPGGSWADLLDPLWNTRLYDPPRRFRKLFWTLDRWHRLYLPSRQGHVSHDLLEVYLWRHSGLYRHRCTRGYCWSDQFLGEKRKEVNEERGKVILSASDLRKYYGEFCALDGVSFQINEGEFVSIIGPNGAGKTTLINVLTGLLTPNTGKGFF